MPLQRLLRCWPRLSCEIESKGHKLDEGELSVPELPICWWRAAEMIKGDVLGSGCFPCGGSPSGSPLPCETVSKGHKPNENELAVPGLPICWWAAVEKAAAAHAYDDYKIDSSSCAAANSSNEASIWGTCQKEKEKVIQFFVNKGEGS